MSILKGLAALENAEQFLINVNTTMRVIVFDLFPEYSDLLVEMNQKQLELRIKATAKPILPPYSPYTIQQKKKKNQVYKHVTLKDEGDFHKGIVAKKHSTYIKMDSTDPKKAAIVGRYGPEIFGITKGNLAVVRQLIYPLALEQIKKRYLP